jgi:hypothetical protein
MRFRILVGAALLLAGSGLSAPAQPAAPVPAAVSAVPAEAAPSLDAWYKVMVQTRHIGYARTTITRLQENSQPVIRIVTETSYTDWEKGLPVSGRTESVLRTDDLSIMRYRFAMDMTLPIGRAELVVTCDRRDKTKWAVLYQGPEGRYPIENLNSETPLTVEEAFSLLVASKPNVKKEGGTLRARTFNPYHLQKLQFDAEIEVLSPETRPYNGQDTKVIPYRWKRPYLGSLDAQLIETEYATETGEVFEMQWLRPGSVVPVSLVRVKSEEEALPEGRHLVKRRGRRDPFDRNKVLTPVRSEKDPKTDVKVGDDTGPKAAPSTPGQEIDKLLLDARRAVEAAEGVFKEFGELGRERIRKLYNDFLDVFLRLQNNPSLTNDKRAELEALRVRIERVYPGALAVLEHGKKLLGQAREEMDAQAKLPLAGQNYTVALKVLGDTKALENSPEFRIAPQQAAVFGTEVLQPVKQMEERILARQQFQKIKLDVTGIIYHLVETPYPVDAGLRMMGQDLRVAGSVPVFVSKSGAIINGAAVSEGDVLDLRGIPAPDTAPENGVLVLKIRPDEVVFRYRGEEISNPLR